ncbi:uncharacterized protein LOC105683962 isoform X2 [Athalia rosae]|uniref:uncharacterized protein LOC105683962 isoform X2 n=1 Tax=Athalia rosae TaxID=37344 RepID=UPI0020337069|nr:uncharacterized protein LOC105683962 isoform X2 [Athalia rosae]
MRGTVDERIGKPEGLEIEEPEVKVPDGNASRAQWGRDLEFLFSCIAFSVGLGNVWRFPYTAYENGGGAFLIPYLVVLFVIGKPFYYMEMILGQFSSKSCVGVWSVSPGFKGIGVGVTLATFCLTTYYCVLMALTLFYLISSFQTVLPWSECWDEWGDRCLNFSTSADNFTANNATRSSSAELYFTSEGRSPRDKRHKRWPGNARLETGALLDRKLVRGVLRALQGPQGYRKGLLLSRALPLRYTDNVVRQGRLATGRHRRHSLPLQTELGEDNGSAGLVRGGYAGFLLVGRLLRRRHHVLVIQQLSPRRSQGLLDRDHSGFVHQSPGGYHDIRDTREFGPRIGLRRHNDGGTRRHGTRLHILPGSVGQILLRPSTLFRHILPHAFRPGTRQQRGILQRRHKRDNRQFSPSKKLAGSTRGLRHRLHHRTDLLHTGGAAHAESSRLLRCYLYHNLPGRIRSSSDFLGIRCRQFHGRRGIYERKKTLDLLAYILGIFDARHAVHGTRLLRIEHKTAHLQRRGLPDLRNSRWMGAAVCLRGTISRRSDLHEIKKQRLHLIRHIQTHQRMGTERSGAEEEVVGIQEN